MTIDIFGSSEFCLPTADKIRGAGYDVRLVTTQSPPSHKSRLEQHNPVKEYSVHHQLPVIEIRTADELTRLYDHWPPPICSIVASFGRIIPPSLLTIPARQFVNIHPSLLPLHRGPSPIQSTILSADTRTGVTIILLDEQVDHGPIIAVQETDMDPNEATPGLSRRLSMIGSELMVSVIKSWIDGVIQPTPQEHSRATMSEKIRKENGRLDWSAPAATIVRQWRAYTPWPGTWTTLTTSKGTIEQIKLFELQETDASPKQTNAIAGTILEINNQHQLVIQAGQQTSIGCASMQRPGKNRMDIDAFLRGYPDIIGKRFI